MRKKKGTTVALVVFFVVLIMAAVTGLQLAKKYMPSKEMQNLNEYFGISGEEVAIFYDGEILETYPAKLGEVYSVGKMIIIPVDNSKESN